MTEISRLNGAREVDVTDIGQWMVNKRKANDNSEGASFFISNFVSLRELVTGTESDWPNAFTGEEAVNDAVMADQHEGGRGSGALGSCGSRGAKMTRGAGSGSARNVVLIIQAMHTGTRVTRPAYKFTLWLVNEYLCLSSVSWGGKGGGGGRGGV